MKVAFLAAEMAPYAHVGGLGDVSRWLPSALALGGDDVAAFLPHYDVLRGAPEIIRVADAIQVPGFGEIGLSTLGVSTLGDGSGDGATIYLIDAPEMFARGAVYPMDGDDHIRYAWFTAGVIAACGQLDWVPDVFHANDFHTAMLPLHAMAAGEPWADVPVVVTIHNLAFQGHFPLEDLATMGLGGQEQLDRSLRRRSGQCSRHRHSVRRSRHHRQPDLCQGDPDARAGDGTRRGAAGA